MKINLWKCLSLCLTAAALGLLAACAPSAATTLPPSPSDPPASRPAATLTAPPSEAPTANSSPTPAPSASPAPTLTAAAAGLFTARGAFFAVSVADLQASVQWYTSKLGLTITLQPPKANGVSVVVLEGSGLIVELIQADGGVALTQLAPPLTDRVQLLGLVKAGVIVDDFDQTVARLRANQVTIAFGPYPASANQPANVIIQDNEGNLIQFFGK